MSIRDREPDFDRYPISGRPGFAKEPKRQKLQVDIPGRILLDSATKDQDVLVVLYELPGSTYQPYVTWMARRDRPEDTFWGHYFETLGEAQEDFEKRLGKSWDFSEGD